MCTCEPRRRPGFPLSFYSRSATSKAVFNPTRSTFQDVLSFRRHITKHVGLLRRSGDNVDIGLMQVNWRLWGKRFDLSKFELLDPQLNVVAGAKILEHCIRVSGSWWKGVGLYHSPENLRQRDYIEKVWRSYRLVLTKMRK